MHSALCCGRDPAELSDTSNVPRLAEKEHDKQAFIETVTEIFCEHQTLKMSNTKKERKTSIIIISLSYFYLLSVFNN